MRTVVVGLFVGGFIGFLAPAASSRAVAAPDLQAQLDAIVAPHFPADQPGAAVLVSKGDRILLRRGYGMADLGKALPIQPGMVFRLGSITKQFTAAAIMMLVDAGKVSLGDDLRKWVPEYPGHGGTVITVEHLLTHTAGVPSYTDQPGFIGLSRKDLTHAELLATFKDLPLDFPPGDRMKYSNSGYYLLGMVIEKASGKSYAQFVAEKIFKPLGMAHTRYGDNDAVMPGGVRGYLGRYDQGSAGGQGGQGGRGRQGGQGGQGTTQGAKEDSKAHLAEAISMKPPFAAGALISTVDDLALWDSAIAAGKLLKKESWRRVFAPMKLKDGSLSQYGYGWQLANYEGHRIQSHSGGIPGFATSICRMPDDQVVVTILCNEMPARTDLRALSLQLAALTIRKTRGRSPRGQDRFKLLDGYAGVYTTSDKDRVMVRRVGDHLAVQPPKGGGFREALPASDSVFFVKRSVIRFWFLRDLKSGRVTGVDVTRPDATIDHCVRSDEALPAEKAGVTVDSTIIERYVGNYELKPGFVIAVTREGARLFTQATNQPGSRVFPSSETEFSPAKGGRLRSSRSISTAKPARSAWSCTSTAASSPPSACRSDSAPNITR